MRQPPINSINPRTHPLWCIFGIGKEIEILDNPLYVLILKNHYVLNKTLLDISKEYKYAYSHIKRSHGWALVAFKQKFPEKFKR